MQTQDQQAMTAIKNECAAPSLSVMIQRLAAEHKQICSELEHTPSSEWNSARFRALGNREDELHVSLRVLRGLGHLPMQIAEPEQTARTEFEAISRFMKFGWSLDWDKAGFYLDDKADEAFVWFERGYMRAQQAAAPLAAVHPDDAEGPGILFHCELATQPAAQGKA